MDIIWLASLLGMFILWLAVEGYIEYRKMKEADRIMDQVNEWWVDFINRKRDDD